ncbi:MAG TPA: tetratricopeptide repeat protein [Actinocrinis sp.]|nr:tetratricopeptide repeat protein [Actinocrinis sp.]
MSELRRLKDRSGLSLARLAAQTNYSRSSWERWLNGKRPVPLVAVESMARACDTDPAALLELWRRQRAPNAVSGGESDPGAQAGAAAAAGDSVREARAGGAGRTGEAPQGDGRDGAGGRGRDEASSSAAGSADASMGSDNENADSWWDQPGDASSDSADSPGSTAFGSFDGAAPGDQAPRSPAGFQAPHWNETSITADPRPVLPRQLPCAPRHFVGRTAALRELAEVIARRTGTHDGPTLLALDGIAGIGKTSLAIRWAHQVARHFPDGQLYINLRGFDPSDAPMTPLEAVRGFLSAFRVPPEEIPADLDAQSALYRSVLSDRRILLVLDNARDAEQVRPLLPGSASCLTIVTSRSRLTGLAAVEGAHLLPLPLLSDGEAYQLLTSHIGAAQIEAQKNAVSELIARCAGLPLALSIIGARSAARPSFPLAAIADELRETATLMNALSSGAGDAIADVRTVFSWSYRYLSPEAARLFRLLGTHPGPDISAPAAASMAGIPADETRRALRELTQASLLDEHAPGRFTFHDLLRAYAVELAGRLDSDAERHDATHRMLDHYLHTATSAMLHMAPAQAPLPLAEPRAGVLPEQLPSYHSALQWFDAERPTLLSTVERAPRAGFDVHTWQLACAIATFLDRRTHWHNWLAVERTALAAAQRLGDLYGQARTRHDLSRACIRFSLHNEAREHLDLALALYQKLDDPIGRAHVHLDLARSFDCVRAYEEALTHATHALRLFGQCGRRAGQADALNFTGAHLARLGSPRLGLTHCEQALELFRGLGHAYGQAESWDNLGSVHRQLNHPLLAMDCYRHAVDLFGELGDRHNQASALTHLGEVQRASGNADSAHTAWERALTILDDLHHPAVEDVRARLRRDLSHPRRVGQSRSTGGRAGATGGPGTGTAPGAREQHEPREPYEPAEQHC